MAVIMGLHAREILGAEGKPAVEADVFLEDGSWGRASALAGCDDDELAQVLANLNGKVTAELMGLDVDCQTGVDEALTGLHSVFDESKTAGGALLAVSMAVARVAAQNHQLPLWAWLGDAGPHVMPKPWVSILKSGGLDLSLLPCGECSWAEFLPLCRKIGVELRGPLPACELSLREMLAIAAQAAAAVGSQDGVNFAVDMGSSVSGVPDSFSLAGEDSIFSRQELADHYLRLCNEYPLAFIEHGAAGDRESLSFLARLLGKRLVVVFDPLQHGSVWGGEGGMTSLIELARANTVTGMFAAVSDARSAGCRSIVASCICGGTEDAFICDAAVALRAAYIKTGPLTDAADTVKFNRMLRIEEELGTCTHCAGVSRFAGNKR